MTRSPVRVALRLVVAALLSVSAALVAMPTPAAIATSPTDANNADFAAGSVNPLNTATTPVPCGGDSAPQVSSTVPANGATNVATSRSRSPSRWT